MLAVVSLRRIVRSERTYQTGQTDSGVVGTLAVDASAHGRLDGVPDAVSYHTYHVDVPDGLARLTVELDADIDLDLAIKHGSEIRSYRDRADGGDWDHRDMDTANPTTVVVERPAAGRWFIDVFNALGDGHDGDYRLRLSSLASAGVSPAPAGAPRELPSVFQRIEHTTTSGEILLARFPDAVSARAVAGRVLKALTPYFEKGPEPLAAVGDAGDRELHVSFGAQAGGQVRTGLLVVRVNPDGAAAGVVHDRSVASNQSLPKLLATLDRQMPAAVPVPVEQNWRRVPFPDGSGSVELPDGWQVVASVKGMADIVGPDGGYAALGIWAPILDPATGLQMQQMFGSTSGSVVAPYADPLSALQQVFPQLLPGVRREVTRIIGHAPVPFPAAGQAAYIDFEFRTTELGGIQDRRGVTLVTTMPGYGQWVYYFSMVSSPAENFERLLPTMVRIWESYQVAGQVLQERLDNARRDLAEVDRILQQSQETRQVSMDRIAANWTEALRDQTVIEDVLLQERHHDAPLGFVDELVEGLNRQVGYERYRHVPLRDLR
jgi:hypothetical protein